MTDPKVGAKAPGGAVLAHPLKVERACLRLLEQLVLVPCRVVLGRTNNMPA